MVTKWSGRQSQNSLYPCTDIIFYIYGCNIVFLLKLYKSVIPHKTLPIGEHSVQVQHMNPYIHSRREIASKIRPCSSKIIAATTEMDFIMFLTRVFLIYPLNDQANTSAHFDYKMWQDNALFLLFHALLYRYQFHFLFRKQF